MDKELRILILEDVPLDAELQEHELRKAELVFTSKVVDTKEAFLKELDEFSPDLILSDYDLPSFDGLAALRIVQEKCPDVPFILVTGKVGEEFVIDKLKDGATDYVLKGNLKRLVPAVNRALEEAKMITERKQAEEALKAERQRLRDVMEAMPIMICLLTPDYHVAFANRAFRDKFGKSHGRHCYEYCFGKKEPCDFCETYRVLKTGKPHHWQVTTLDSASVIDVYDFPFTDVDGSPMILEVDIDITKRKKAEEKLRESEERYSTMVNSSPNLVFVHKNGIIQYINEIGLKIMGYQKEEIIGKPMFDFISDDSKELVAKNMQRRLAGEHVENYEAKVLTKSQDIKYFLVSAAVIPYERDQAFLAVLSDITNRKRAEELMHKSEEKYRALYDNAPDMYHSLDKDGIIIECNETEAKMLGYKKEEIIGRPVADFFTEESKRLFEPGFTKLKEKKVLLNIEREFIRKDGTSFPAMLNVFSVYNEDGEFIGTKTISRDITIQKQAEEKTRQKMDEITRINKLFIGREHRFIELKKEVNALLEQLGQSKKYDL